VQHPVCMKTFSSVMVVCSNWPFLSFDQYWVRKADG
jgi:hypothetical protein